MHGINWDDLRYCLAVVRAGSVTAAARTLKVNQTTVSRRISALEQQLNAAIFDRSTTGWLVTPVGETILRSIEQMDDAALMIQRLVQVDRQELSGTLKVTAVDVAIQHLLLPGLNAFAQQYPLIDIQLIASDLPFDLGTHEADIAFRTTNDPPPNVLGTHIADFAYAIYATHDVFRRFQQEPDSVGAITWLMDIHSNPEWMVKAFPGMAVRYRANSLSVAFDMVRQGLGIAMLPCGLGDASGRLRRIPIDFELPRNGFWLLSHIDLRTTARIRIFRDFMLEHIQPYIPLIEGQRERYYEQPLAAPLD